MVRLSPRKTPHRRGGEAECALSPHGREVTELWKWLKCKASGPKLGEQQLAAHFQRQQDQHDDDGGTDNFAAVLNGEA